MSRLSPNVIVTGTPGVGKTSHCEIIAQTTGLRHLSINQLVKERGCHESYDEHLQTYIVDEDRLLDILEEDVPQGGYLIDWHACELFPRSWIDLVVVLRTDSTTLYDRLKARNYPEAKLQENLDSEIMEVLLGEARESYDPAILVELRSDSVSDMEDNVERVEAWTNRWKADRKEGG